MAQTIDGRSLRQKILASLKNQISSEDLKAKLAIVQVGSDPASSRYIEQKQKAAEEIGAEVVLYKPESGVSFAEIEELVERLNKDKTTNGIIVQLPLPETLDKEKVLNLVEPKKDVDGLVVDSPFQPATPAGIMEILHSYKVPIKDKTVVVVGQSDLVGSPLSRMLEEEGAEVIRIDINTPRPIDPLVQKGEIVVSAVGKPGLITAEMIKPGAVVIDAGTTLNKEGKLIGDVDFEKIKEKASLITPVPGGVGPLTVAMLLKNLVAASGS